MSQKSAYSPALGERGPWNSLVASMEHAQFLQSFEWGAFQESLGREVMRLPSALVIRLPLMRDASYLYCPRGPLATDAQDFIGQVPIQRGDVFIRCEPIKLDRGLPSSFVKTYDIQPRREWIVSLVKGYDALESAMHPKTRYNIHRADKKGVQIRAVSSARDLETEDSARFVTVMQETARRRRFHLHDSEYYRALIAFFLPPHVQPLLHNDLFARLYLADYRSKVIAGILVFFFGDTATYVHGGALLEHREVMAPHALHARALADAIAMNYHYYNFGGITASENPLHPWSGMTRFKRGFGGESFLYPGTYDHPLRPLLYGCYKAGRAVHRWLRH